MEKRYRHRTIIVWFRLAVVLLILGAVVIEAADEGSIEEAETLNQQAQDLYENGHYQEAILLAERALRIAEKRLGPEHLYTATALNNLSELYRATGAYGKGEPLVQQALTIYEKVLGSEHPHTASALNNLPETSFIAPDMGEPVEIG